MCVVSWIVRRVMGAGARRERKAGAADAGVRGAVGPGGALAEPGPASGRGSEGALANERQTLARDAIVFYVCCDVCVVTQY